MKSLKAALITFAMFVGVLAQATPAHAQSQWYWYYSTGGPCWNTVAGPSHGGPSYACDSPGASYLQNNYVHNGARGDVTDTTGSGDYCNSYANSQNAFAFTQYLDSPSNYYWGDPTTQSYCYANGTTWGTNVNEQANTSRAGGAQHFASVKGTAVYPWASSNGFGSSPLLYIDAQFGAFTNTSSQAWGYLCADFLDTAGSSQILELCGDEWDWGNKMKGLGYGTGDCSGPIYGAPDLAMEFQKFNSSYTHYFTTRNGTTSTSKTLARGTDFSLQISTTQLLNAAKQANTDCSSHVHLTTTSASGYKLVGVEDGIEQGGSSTGQVNAEEKGLIFATLY
jgi:hypothetical protein